MATKEEVMANACLSEDEFDEFYSAVLDLIRQHGTNGIHCMVAYIEQELNAGREDIE